jgi:Tol biopolymer transport system component
MMKNLWLASTLSLSLGVSLLAGCGTTPTAAGSGTNAATAPGAKAPSTLTGGARAQEGVGMPGMPAAPAPETPASAAPTNGGDSGGTPGAQPGAPGAPVGPVGPPSMPEGSVISPGIGGGIVVGPPPAFGPEGANGIIAFMSDRDTGGGKGFDIFVYDAVAATVLALPGVNTYADEVNPRLSSNGAWLVYQSDETGDNDILIFDLRNQLINTLQTLNTYADETQPDISDDGRMIVYVSNEIRDHGYDDKGGYKDDKYNSKDGKGGKNDFKDFKGKRFNDELRIFDALTGNNFRVPVANRGLTDITWPSISGNGEIIAYGGSETGYLKDSDIFVYSLLAAAQLTPPFVNTEDGEYNPDLDLTGSLIAFVSDRRGSEDLYAVDLKSGFTDNLVLANTDYYDEQEPRWLAGPGGQLIFHSDRSGEFRLYAYDMATALVDTLPVANEPFTNTQLRDEYPELLGYNDFKDTHHRDFSHRDHKDHK